jgi:3-phenylpropionate/trans-cinnamate dioxygenase ferredoxin reductase component
MTTKTLAIVGASLAGAKAAEAARGAGYDDRIVLIGDEPDPPYERPPLSKAVLRGEADPDSARVHDPAFYTAHAVERIVDRAISLDVAARRVELADGPSVAFSQAILTTGASPRRLAVAGSELAGVHHLRTVADATALRDAIRRAGRVAVIGAGWIGSEVTASARQVGAEVVLIDPAPTPLHHLLGDRLGGVFRDLHAEHGVSLRLGAGVAALRGRTAVEAVVLDDGTVEAADVVVVGIGVAPCTELADRAAGIDVDDGIVVDQHLETTVAGIFAAGDVASAWHPHYRRRLRVEHWANALNQGVTAGRNAAGAGTAYTRLPYFFSDQYDLGLEYVGHHHPEDALVVRGDLGGRKFIALWHRDGVVSAGMSVNVWDVVDELKAIIETGTVHDPAGLGDVDVPLPQLRWLSRGDAG